MSDDPFPSGPWTGFYNYTGPEDRYRMDLRLTFANGRMIGEGNDSIGGFTIRGNYDTATRECRWVKQYIGKHAVDYRGFGEGKGIWGTWNIQHFNGGFHIWPLASGSTDQALESEESNEPLMVKGVEMPGSAF